MNPTFIYISLGMLVVLFVFSTVLYRRFRIWKFLLLLIAAGTYVMLWYFPDVITVIDITAYESYYVYVLYALVVLFGVTFKHKIRVTKNLTDYDFFEIEKELEDIRETSELLRLRFIQTLSLVDEGIIFYDESLEGLFVTEQVSAVLNTDRAEFSMEDYVDRISEDDRNQYLSVIRKAWKKQTGYQLKYRVVTEQGTRWVEENGKAFLFGKKRHLIASVKPLDIKLFPKTTLDEIDALPTEEACIRYLSSMIGSNEPFHLVMFQLTNIPDVNKRLGRDAGNLLIAEYIKKMRYHFAKGPHAIFRITGIQFAMIIKDKQKFDILLRALESGGELVNLNLKVGGIEQVVYPNLGIMRFDAWSNYKADELMTLATKTMNEAIRNKKQNYAVYGK